MNIIIGSDKELSIEIKNKFSAKVNGLSEEYRYEILSSTDKTLIFSKGDGETFTASDERFDIIFDGYAYGYSEKNFKDFLKNE